MHLVDKHIFDIQYDSESTAIDMQRKISTISNEKLFERVCEIFDEFETQETIRIDSLELDLGRLRESHLEEDLLDAVTISLRRELGERIELTRSRNTTTSDKVAQERNHLSIFEQFMLSGTVPWWIRNRNNFDLEKIIAEVLESHIGQIAAIVRKQAQKKYFLERLVLNLNEDQLKKLIQALAPAEASQVIEAAQNIQKVQEQRRIVSTEQRIYRNKVWEFVLTYLLIDRGTAFNQKMFVQATLARLAHHFNVEYTEFLTLFYDAVKEMDRERTIPGGLVEIIKEIYSEREIASTTKSVKRSKIEPEIIAVYTQLLESTPKFDKTFEAQILKLIRAKSAVFTSFIRRESKNRLLHRNLVQALSDPSLYQFVGFIEPQSKDVIVQFSGNVRQLKDKSHVTLSGSSSEFRDVTWEFIIRALLEDRGSQFNLKSFVKTTLSNIAAHFNIALHDLMHYVLLELEVYHSIDKSSLESVLLEIKEEEDLKTIQENTEDKALFRLKIKLQWIDYALMHSQFPVWSKRHELSENDFQKVLFELIGNNAGKVQKLLRSHLRANRKRHFLIQQLDQQGRYQIVRFLNAQAAEKIMLYDKLLDKVQERRSIAANKHEFESIKWSTILEILTEEKGSFFNYKTFVLRSLHELSNRLGIAFDVLFSYVLEVSSTLPNMPESPLQNALLSIQKELKSSVDKWSPENVVLEGELEAIWNKVKNDAPPEARLLVALLQKMHADLLFRSQFDLYSWLREHKSISKDVFRSILKEFQWKVEDLTVVFGGQQFYSDQKILTWLLADEHPFISYYLQDLNKIIGYTNLNKSVLSIQAELFTAAYLAKHATVDKHLYFQKLLWFLSRFIGIKPKDFLLEIQTIIKSELTSLNSTLPLSVSKAIHGERMSDIALDKDSEKKQEELIELEEEPEEEQLEEEEEDWDNIYIENAGIVIFWPFLRQFFNTLELIEEDAFVSIAAKIRAVQLLQYMCTGETSFPEHELILNKIICGIPVNIPIDDSFEINTKEKEVADSMILGLIANWTGMQETSVEALRETFLIRAAKISFEEETVDMNVEKKAVDILFDRLPWSFTFVNLPWMKKPLRTIWK